MPDAGEPPATQDLNELRSENLRLRVELERAHEELERAREGEAEAVAENRRIFLRLAELEGSSGVRVDRALRGAARRGRRVLGGGAAEVSSPGAAPDADAGAACVPLAALRGDLDGGWPEHACWRSDVRVGGPPVTALQQPIDSSLRYRLILPAGAGIRMRVALSARNWREAAGGALASVALHDSRGRSLAERSVRLAIAADGGTWAPESIELTSPEAGEVVLVLQATAEPAELPAPHVLWVAPEIVLAAPQRTTLPPLSVNGPQAAAMAARDPGAPATADEPRPLISILTPVHDPDPRMLGELLRAVRRQPFTDWELCLVDDGGADLRVRELLEQAAASDARIHLRRRPQNGGISVATNDALGMARGRYVAFLDHDDVLAEDALGAVAEAIAADPSLDALYTDEDHITHADQRFAPLRKPDWSPDSLRSQMYTGHLGVLRRELVDDVGGLRPEFEGSQDYDLMLRISERTARIDHVDQLLYHWRVVPSSASFGDRAKPYAYEAGKRALQEHADRLRLRASVVHGETRGTYRMVYETDPRMAVDIVLDVGAEPPRGLPAVLEAAGHERWRLVLLGCQEGALRWEAALAAGGIERDRIMRLPDLAALGNDATAPGELLLFVSEAPSRATDGWLRTMMGFAGLEGVAAVGAKVLAADGRLERGGVVIGHGLPLPVCHAARGDEAGHLSNLVTTVNRSAVDGVVMARRDVLDRVGWLGPSLSDTALADYCLRAREKDLRVIWTPDARLQLGGPASAGDVAALDAFRTRWAARVGADPFYSRAFSQQRADYTPV